MKNIFLIFLLFVTSGIYAQPDLINFVFKNEKSIDSTLSFRGICAVDKDIAWVSGTKGAVYKTNNGGKSWQKIIVPGSDSLDFRDVEVIGKNTIVLMSAGPAENSKIFKSIDNGKTWKVVYINHHPEGFLDTIEFWNEKNGIAIGDPVNGIFNILLTDDAGNSWKDAYLQNIPPAKDGEAQFAASGTCISLVGKNLGWIGTGGKISRVLKTTDSGKTWLPYQSPILQGESATGIFSIHFQNKIDGIIVGGDYLKENKTDSTAAISENGGISWNLITNKLPYQSAVKSFLRGNKTAYISTGPSGTFYSTDKFKWNKIGSGYHCLGVGKKDNSIWLAGSNGRVAGLITN